MVDGSYHLLVTGDEEHLLTEQGSLNLTKACAQHL